MRIKSQGFTVIELLVVIAIAGILTAIALPSFTQSLARKRLEGVANELSTDLYFAKSQSVSANTNVTLLTRANGYTITSAIANYKTVTFTSEIALNAAVSVVFEPYQAIPTSLETITISNQANNISLNVKTSASGLIVICSPSTGFGMYVTC